ncbi:MAG: DMT family transporter [Dysgonamonadaceae bacterium]|nr:DMT family transporter [Dysgonamonadaceae bacterium]
MQDKNLKGHIALGIAYVIFGLNTPVSKEVLMHGEVSALALTFYRFGGAGIFFLLISFFTKKEHVAHRDIGWLFLASMFGIFINQASFVVGLSLTSPIDASVITTIVPILTMVLAAFFLKEPITWKKVTGVLIGASGALLLVFSSNTSVHENASIEGNLLCMLGALSFAIYLTAFKKLINRYSALTLMKWMFLFAALCSLPLCWRDIVAVDYAGMPIAIYLRILFVIAFATFISYLLIPIGQKLLRPTIVSMYNYLQPLVSSLLAVALGMDMFGWTKGIATILVFLGVYIVTQSKSRTQMEQKNGMSKKEQ